MSVMTTNVKLSQLCALSALYEDSVRKADKGITALRLNKISPNINIAFNYDKQELLAITENKNLVRGKRYFF